MNNLVKTNDLKMESIEKLSKRLEYGKAKKILDERNKYFKDAIETDKEKLVLGEIGIRVYKAYLPVISERYEPIRNCLDEYKEELGMAYFDVTKWVHDSEEKGIDKLVNVYQTLSDQDCSIALIYDRDHKNTKVTLAVANNNAVERSETIKLVDRISGALNGNFPGVEFNHVQNNRCSGYGVPKCLKEINGDVSVAAVSAIPSEKSEHFISQSIEKLLDGIVPRENDKYTLVLLGRPNRFVEDEKLELYNLYSQLSPLAEVQKNTTYNISASLTNSDTISLSKSVGGNLGISFIVGAGLNTNFGTSYAKTVSETITGGESKGTTRTYTNYGIKHTMENIEMQIKRMEESDALGLWDFSAYVYSTDPKLTQNVAYSYLSLIQGEKSFLGTDAVNYWDGSSQEDVGIILESLRRLRHPFFVLKDSIIMKDKDCLMYPPHVECAMSLSGKELAYAMNFPRKSVSGLPVYESASFGRDVQYYEESRHQQSDKIVDVGNIFHMRHKENIRVELDLNSFTSHAFVTGSTGAGKTNTILELLSKAQNKGVKFLVIEPAKGEYKSYIGGDCHVYGTNPRLFDLLRLNPFSFPENIHVLEHIDRLIEILNACWPMYAAMPAVLKDAIERAYIDKGWDLNGFNYNPSKFPTFEDLLETLPQVMEESEYSGDTKSDYAGALITRVKSLTNGINGQILCSNDEIPAEELFDENVIADLSRVSSTETKALIMGILVMKLQEYKINLGEDAFTKELTHLTVLEEAHNLLRKTSIMQSQEGANLQGKSVEMITNAIAEMRAYGEGFIIVDQSPGLLDEAVIRNTNTKIILRLPDIDDRKLVGKAEALKDIQIDELAKLPMGVAAVYQNDWVEAVLCQFDEFKDYNPMEKVLRIGNSHEDNDPIIQKFLKNVFSQTQEPLDEQETECVKKWIESPRFSDITKRTLREALNNDLDEETRIVIAYNVFEGTRIAKYLLDSYTEEAGIKKANELIRGIVNISDENLINVIRNNIIHALYIQNTEGNIAKRYERGDVSWRFLH